jgi:hypothetical protein
MINKCRQCKEQSNEEIELIAEAPGWLECPVCKRSVELPFRSEESSDLPGLPVSSKPRIANPRIITWDQLGSRGLERKDVAGPNAYQKEQPEFSMEDVPF